MAERIRKIPPLERDQDGRAICRHWDCTNLVPKGRRSWCGNDCVHDALMQTNPSYARQQVEQRDHGVCAQCGVDTKAIRRQIACFRGFMSWIPTEKRIADRFGLTPREVQKASIWVGWNGAREHRERMIERGHRTRTSTMPEPPLDGIDPEEAYAVDRFIRRLERLVRGTANRYFRRMTERGFDRGRRSFWDMDHIEEVVRGGSYRLENLQTLCQPCHKAKTARLAAERAMERKGEQALPGLGP